jgi:hypothetical protein
VTENLTRSSRLAVPAGPWLLAAARPRQYRAEKQFRAPARPASASPDNKGSPHKTADRCANKHISCNPFS